MEKDPLSDLRDIHLPDPGGFWPPAPGWWVLLAVGLIVIAGSILILYRRYRRNRWLGLALAELAELERTARQDHRWFTDMNRLLKRSARVRFPERHPDSLSGHAWIDFLSETCPGNSARHTPVFTALVESSWRPETNGDPDQILATAKYWLRGQRC